jgi:tRNA dimethylallyltransferase
MSIGTAKPTAEELTAVHHYFIDEFPVETALAAADYETLALGYLEEIFKHNDAAVVCGGTGLYIKALTEGLDNMPEINAEISKEVNEDYQVQGLQWLQDAVRGEDPEFYAEGETKNPARLIRALVFKRSTGESIIHFRTGEKKQRPFRVVKVALELPRELLYERINYRVDQMMEEGLIEEVKALFPRRELKNLQTVGYSELFDHLEGKCTLEEAVDKIKQHTRNYAKRQLTWFKKDKEFVWLDARDDQAIKKILALK